ncbi:uncharacterized protein LOC128961921 [Oppia nitens]|uniref:uncharacterized protein LOC128961921 n=1 Tax=Oppia nitens TaxID=1686743 RepID=UPI0023DA3EFE|nr:uncharacterized protein LOC128961921 [Oppia nitens]
MLPQKSINRSAVSNNSDLMAKGFGRLNIGNSGDQFDYRQIITELDSIETRIDQLLDQLSKIHVKGVAARIELATNIETVDVLQDIKYLIQEMNKVQNNLELCELNMQTMNNKTNSLSTTTGDDIDNDVNKMLMKIVDKSNRLADTLDMSLD